MFVNKIFYTEFVIYHNTPPVKTIVEYEMYML